MVKIKFRPTVTQIVTAALMLIAVAALAVYYARTYKYHFFWHEQNQLFLMSADWLATYFGKPAWAACMAGEFLTQLYYYLYAGPVVFALVVTATAALVGRALRTLMPWWAAAILAAGVWWWFATAGFATRFALSQPICWAGGALVYLCTRRAGVWGVASVALAYWMFGYGAWLTGALFIGLAAYRCWKPALCTTAAAAALALLMPLAMKGHYVLKYTRALTYPGFSIPQKPDLDAEETLAIDNEYYFGNYRRAAELAAGTAKPTRLTSFYLNLANAKLGELPDHLLLHEPMELGTLITIGEDTPLAMINMMNELYYEIGDMMYAERAAMMRNVFSHRNRNARMIKRLAEINLASGDIPAATKYLRMLERTLAYRGWARERMPGQMSESAAAMLDLKRTLINTRDNIRIGDNCRTILTETLDSNPQNIIALDYLLCTDLLLKDIDAFKYDYDRYCTSQGTPRLKPIYQQALMIWLVGTDAKKELWNKYILMPDQRRRFVHYNQQRGAEAFNDTYWYYFDTHPVPEIPKKR